MLPTATPLDSHQEECKDSSRDVLTELVLADCEVEIFMEAFLRQFTFGWHPFSRSVLKDPFGAPPYLIELVTRCRTDILWALFHIPHFTLSDTATASGSELASLAYLITQSPYEDVVELFLDYVHAHRYALSAFTWFEIAFASVATQYARETIMEEIIPLDCRRWFSQFPDGDVSRYNAHDGLFVRVLQCGGTAMAYFDWFLRNEKEVELRYAIRRARREKRLSQWRDSSTLPPTPPFLEARERLRLRHWSQVHAKGDPDRQVHPLRSCPARAMSCPFYSTSTFFCFTTPRVSQTEVTMQAESLSVASSAALSATSPRYSTCTCPPSRPFARMLGMYAEAEYVKVITAAAKAYDEFENSPDFWESEVPHGFDLPYPAVYVRYKGSHVIAYISPGYTSSVVPTPPSPWQQENEEEKANEEHDKEDGDFASKSSSTDGEAIFATNAETGHGTVKFSDVYGADDASECVEESDAQSISSSRSPFVIPRHDLHDCETDAAWYAKRIHASVRSITFDRPPLLDPDHLLQDPFLSFDAVDHMERSLVLLAKALYTPVRALFHDYPMKSTYSASVQWTIAAMLRFQRLQILTRLFRAHNFGVPLSFELLDYAVELFSTRVARGYRTFGIFCALLGNTEGSPSYTSGPLMPWTLEWATQRVPNWLLLSESQGGLSRRQMDLLFQLCCVFGADWLINLMLKHVVDLHAYVTLTCEAPMRVIVGGDVVDLASEMTRLDASTTAHIIDKYPSLSQCRLLTQREGFAVEQEGKVGDAAVSHQSCGMRRKAREALRQELGALCKSEYKWTLVLRYLHHSCTPESEDALIALALGSSSPTIDESKQLVCLVAAALHDQRWRQNRGNLTTTSLPMDSKQCHADATAALAFLRFHNVDIFHHKINEDVLKVCPSLFLYLFSDEQLFNTWIAPTDVFEAVRRVCYLLAVFTKNRPRVFASGDKTSGDEASNQVFGAMRIKALELCIRAVNHSDAALVPAAEAVAAESHCAPTEIGISEAASLRGAVLSCVKVEVLVAGLRKHFFFESPQFTVHHMKHYASRMCMLLDRLARYPTMSSLFTRSFYMNMLEGATKARIISIASWAFRRIQDISPPALVLSRALPDSSVSRAGSVDSRISSAPRDTGVRRTRDLILSRYNMDLDPLAGAGVTVLHTLCMEYWSARGNEPERSVSPVPLILLNHILDMCLHNCADLCSVPDSQLMFTPLMLVAGFDRHEEVENALLKIICCLAATAADGVTANGVTTSGI